MADGLGCTWVSCGGFTCALGELEPPSSAAIAPLTDHPGVTETLAGHRVTRVPVGAHRRTLAGWVQRRGAQEEIHVRWVSLLRL